MHSVHRGLVLGRRWVGIRKRIFLPDDTWSCLEQLHMKYHSPIICFEGQVTLVYLAVILRRAQ